MNAEEEQRENLGETLVKSVTDTSLSDVFANAADITLDAFMDEGLLKDIPVFGWIFKTYKAGVTISELILSKKIALFLHEISTISYEDIEKFRQQIDNDGNFNRKVGENLLLLLDRQDQFEKSSMLGKLFSHYIRGVLDYDDFLRLATCVDRASVKDLRLLPDYYVNFESLDFQTVQDLYSSGLASIEKPRTLGSAVTRDPLVKFVRNDAGGRLAQILAAN